MRVLLVTHGTYFNPDRVVSGNSVRAYYLAKGLMHHGVHVTFAYPRELDPRGVFVPDSSEENLTIRGFDGPSELVRIVGEEKPRAIIVGYWELLEYFPEGFHIPIIADILAPRLLEGLFQEERDLASDAERMISRYRRASRFMCATPSQRSLLLPVLILAGFDCRFNIPVDIVPISTMPREDCGEKTSGERLRIVSGGVSWPWRNAVPYIEAIAEGLSKDGGIDGELVLLSGKYTYDSKEGIDHGLERVEATYGSRIRRLGLLPYGEMEQLFCRNCDVGLELSEMNVEREFSSSFRSIEYLRCGLPIICNKGLDLASDIETFEAGWSVGGPEELPGLLRDIVADEEAYRRRSENALKLVSAKHDYRKSVRPMMEYLESLPGAPRQGKPFSRIIEEKNRLLRENSKARVEMGVLQEALKDRETQIENLLRSYSWRMMRPFRAVVDHTLRFFQTSRKFAAPFSQERFRWDEPGFLAPAVGALAEAFKTPVPMSMPKGRVAVNSHGPDDEVIQGHSAGKRDFSVAIVTREDIFPTNHGAAVRIERTASALSHFTESVFVVTGDISRYFLYRNGVVEERFYPRRTRLAGLCAIGAAKKLATLGIPRNEAFLYRAIFDRGFFVRLACIASRNKIGLFHAEFPAYATACLAAQKRFSGRTLLVEHNVECDRIRAQYEDLSETAYQWLLHREVTLCNAVDHVITVSDRDRDSLISHGVEAQRIHTIPHGVDLELYRETYEFDLRAELGIHPEIPIIIYHGRYSYSPNLEAVAAIAGEILPRLEARGVKAKVAAIGPDAPRGNVFPDVVFTGPVDNLAPYLMKADVALVPLLKGGGTRMKILEYFAAGIPVVTTSKGLEGIPAQNGSEVIVEDSFDLIADAVVELLKRPDKAKKLTDNAKAFVERLDWLNIAERYMRVFEELQ